jgi:hypothetical protein
MKTRKSKKQMISDGLVREQMLRVEVLRLRNAMQRIRGFVASVESTYAKPGMNTAEGAIALFEKTSRTIKGWCDEELAAPTPDPVWSKERSQGDTSAYTYREWSIPERMMVSIQNYIHKGQPVGEFLQTVICHADLFDAVSRADDVNKKNLPAYCVYFHCEVPGECHGSREIYEAWIKKFKDAKELTEEKG